MPIDKSPLVIKEFKGILLTNCELRSVTTSSVWDTKIPFEYALESTNFTYLKKGGIRTRDGIDRYVFFNNGGAHLVGRPVQMWRIDILNSIPQVDRWMILTWDGATGRLYDTGSAIGNPILTLAGMKYAYVLNAFSRMYITPWSAYATPLVNEFVYVYSGLYAARRIKGVGPTPGAFAAAVAAGGSTTPGLHYISVLFETDTGYISPAPSTHLAPPFGVGPNTPLSATTTAANGIINLTAIPTGAAGTGVVKRHIIMTKVVVNPPLFTANNSGLLGFEPFIVLTINDNVTVVGSINVPDSGLLESAKGYIVDNTTCPSCISLAQYGNRMVYLGPRPTAIESSILVSPPNRPEQIKTVYTPTGIAAAAYVINDINTIYIAPHYSGQVMAGGEVNGIFYTFKEDSTWGIVAENDKDPAEWTEPSSVDSGKGAFPFGVASIGNNPSNNNDSSLIVCGNHGITFFNGKFAQRSLAEGIWESYDTVNLKWAKVLVEPIRQFIFLKLNDPYDDALASNFVLVGNYYNGVEITNIRWSKWTFPYKPDLTANSIIPDIALRAPGTSGNVGAANYSSLYSLLCLLYRNFINPDWDVEIFSEALAPNDFYASTQNVGANPQWVYTTGHTPNEEGVVYSYGPLKVRMTKAYATANQYVRIEIDHFDAGGSPVVITPTTFDPVRFPGKYYSFNMNMVSEHMRVSLTGFGRILIDALTLYRTEVAKDRPRV